MMVFGDLAIGGERYGRNSSFQVLCFKQQLTKRNKIHRNVNKFSQFQNQIKQKNQHGFSSIVFNTPTKETKSRMMSFQNDYVRTAAKKLTICDERKLLIKEKIKIKVKERFIEMLKSKESIPKEERVVENKRQSISREFLDVKIKGQSMKKSQRSIVSCRRQLSKSHQFCKTSKRTISEVKQKEINDKLQTSDSSPKYKSKAEISILKVIRLRDITPREPTRKIHSAMDGFISLPKRPSFQIDPWNSIEDF